MIIKTKALVIKEHIVGESDKYITLFTKDLGTIQVMAPKAKKYNSSIVVGTQLFTYGDFILANYNRTYRLMHLEVIHTFHQLSSDILILSYASYILEFISEVTRENLANDQLLFLTLMTLRALNKNKLSAQLIRRVFELKAMSLLGFMPELHMCTSCNIPLEEHSKATYHFVSEEGGLICNNCIHHYRQAVTIHFSTRYTMRYIIEKPIQQIFSFNVDKIILQELAHICDQYIAFYLSKEFKTIAFITALTE